MLPSGPVRILALSDRRGTMEDHFGAATPPVIRSEAAEIYIVNTLVGWAELRVSVGQHDAGSYAFPLVSEAL